MALAKRNPNTILLSGKEHTILVEDAPAIEAITPGMLIERHDDSGTLKWGVHDAANDPTPRCVALEEIHLNEGIDVAYAIGDQVVAAYLPPGAVFYGIIPSGQNIQVGERLQSNGDGKLKTDGGSGDGSFVSLDAPGSVTEDTRIRVEVIR